MRFLYIKSNINPFGLYNFFEILSPTLLVRQFSSGPISSKIAQKQRQYNEKAFPHDPTLIPQYSHVKRGHRGGWMNNPIRGVETLDPKTSFYRDYIRNKVNSEEERFINSLTRKNKVIKETGRTKHETSSKKYENHEIISAPSYLGTLNSNNSAINDQSHTTRISQKVKQNQNYPIDDYDEHFTNINKIIAFSKRPSEFIEKHMKSLIDTVEDFNLNPHKSKKHGTSLYSHESISIEKEDKLGLENDQQKYYFIDSEELHEELILNQIHENKLSDLWESMKAKMVVYHDVIVPSAFSSGTFSEHQNTRKYSSLFDLSYKSIYKITGDDRLSISEYFLSCCLKDMEIEEVKYSIILDPNGQYLDDCYVSKHKNEILILTSSFQKQEVTNYLISYIEKQKKNSFNIQIRKEENTTCLAVQGPSSIKALGNLIKFNSDRLDDNINSDYKSTQNYVSKLIFHDKNDIHKIPFMSSFSLHFYLVPSYSESFKVTEIVGFRAGFTGEDGFEFLVDSKFAGSFARLLLSNGDIKPAGIYALDILRMEAGLPRSGIDITPLDSPIKASLSWLIDKKKVSAKNIFGWKSLQEQLFRPPKHKRVGIVSKHILPGGSMILSNPHKSVIGNITSCTASPTLKCRISQGYVKDEFAKDGQRILVAIPMDISPKVKRKDKTRLLRKGGINNLVVAKVVRFPFVKHNYPKLRL